MGNNRLCHLSQLRSINLVECDRWHETRKGLATVTCDCCLLPDLVKQLIKQCLCHVNNIIEMTPVVLALVYISGLLAGPVSYYFSLFYKLYRKPELLVSYSRTF